MEKGEYYISFDATEIKSIKESVDVLFGYISGIEASISVYNGPSNPEQEIIVQNIPSIRKLHNALSENYRKVIDANKRKEFINQSFASELVNAINQESETFNVFERIAQVLDKYEIIGKIHIQELNGDDIPF